MKILGWLMLGMLSILCAGLALNNLWNWFLIPLMKLPFLTLKSSMGIVLTIGLLRFMVVEQKRKEVDIEWAFALAIVPLVFLGLGWIVHVVLRG